MNDRDLALIAQLADGTIDAADEPTARALLDASAEARAEFAAQRAALTALREAGPGRLSPTERTALRESLVTQLGLETAPEPVPIRRRRTLPWGGLAVAAATLVGVIALAPLLSLLSTGGGDSADTIGGAALEAPAATDAPAATAAPPGEPAEERATLSQSDDLDSPLGAPPSAVQTTVAALTVPDEAGDFYGAFGLPYLGELSAEELAELETELLSLTPPDAAQWRLSLAGRVGAIEAGPPLLDRLFTRDGCEVAIPAGFTGEAVAIAEVSSATVVIYRLQPDAGDDPLLLLVDLETCTELAATAGS